MTNSTERDAGFGPIELRSGLGGFTWRGLQRTGDTVIKPGRFYRLWNAQINDGEIVSRGGQTLFSSLGSDETRPNCITSVFSVNPEWPDLGSRAELRITQAVSMGVQTPDEPDPSNYNAYRGDTGGFDLASSLENLAGRRHRWLRDGLDNTSSGAETATGTNTSIRIRERVYVANLNGSIRYLDPGTATYTTIAASGTEFASGSRPFCLTYEGRLIVVADGVTKQWNIDTAAWSAITMPGGTTNFVCKGWTVFGEDGYLYIWGTVGNDVKLLQYTGGGVAITVVYTASLTASNWNQAIDVASNNGNIVLTYAQDDSGISGLIRLMVDVLATAALTFSHISDMGPASRMVVADGMIFTEGYASEGTTPEHTIWFSWDGTEWLRVLDYTGQVSSGIRAPVDIVQIAPVDTVVTDDTEL